MENLLQQGMNAAKAGDKALAFQLLTKATQDGATAEQAWLWLTSVLTADAERLFCLDNALRINPNNGPAKNKAAELRSKGIFPALPTPPYAAAPAVVNPPAQTAVPQPIKPPQPVQTSSSPMQPKIPEPPRTNSQQDLSGLFRFAAQELAKKQSPKTIVKKLIDQGVTPATADQIVIETQKVFKKALVEKNKKRMTRGLIWTVVGIVLTCGTLAFSDKLGGGVLFWGAIVFGFIDFIAGLIGWLSNQ